MSPETKSGMTRRAFIAGGIAVFGAAAVGLESKQKATANSDGRVDGVHSQEQLLVQNYKVIEGRDFVGTPSEILDVIFDSAGKRKAAVIKLDAAGNPALQEMLPEDAATNLPAKITPYAIHKSSGIVMIGGSDENDKNISRVWVSLDGLKGKVYTVPNTGTVVQVKVGSDGTKYFITNDAKNPTDLTRQKMWKINVDESIHEVTRLNVLIDLDDTEINNGVFYNPKSNDPGYYKNVDMGTTIQSTLINTHEGIGVLHQVDENEVWHINFDGKFPEFSVNVNDKEVVGGAFSIDPNLSPEFTNIGRVGVPAVTVDKNKNSAILALSLNDAEGSLVRFITMKYDTHSDQKMLPSAGLPTVKETCDSSGCSSTRVMSVSYLNDMVVAKIHSGPNAPLNGYYFLRNGASSWEKIITSQPPVNRRYGLLIPTAAK